MEESLFWFCHNVRKIQGDFRIMFDPRELGEWYILVILEQYHAVVLGQCEGSYYPEGTVDIFLGI